jgi:hypothetical protein
MVVFRDTRALPQGLGSTALRELGRYDEAEVLLLDARRALKDIPGEQGHEANATAARLAVLYAAWGRPEKAVSYRPGASKQ